MPAVILRGATLVWSMRVHTGAERPPATERQLPEVKRPLLRGRRR